MMNQRFLAIKALTHMLMAVPAVEAATIQTRALSYDTRSRVNSDASGDNYLGWGVLAHPPYDGSLTATARGGTHPIIISPHKRKRSNSSIALLMALLESCTFLGSSLFLNATIYIR